MGIRDDDEVIIETDQVFFGKGDGNQGVISCCLLCALMSAHQAKRAIGLRLEVAVLMGDGGEKKENAKKDGQQAGQTVSRNRPSALAPSRFSSE